jgi:hypothetical protein
VELARLVAEQVKEKKLKLPPDAKLGKVVTLYVAERDGDKFHVRYSEQREVGVKRAKPGEGVLSVVDDEDEAEELME